MRGGRTPSYEYRVRRQRRKRKRLIFTLAALAAILTLVIVARADTQTADDLEIAAPPAITTVAAQLPAATPVTYETQLSPVDVIAKAVYGEARGCSITEQAAVVWCICNRVDAGNGDLVEVVTAPYQFHGYNADNPVTPEIEALVQDVLTRWCMEESCIGSVGRVLPKEYLFFSGDGRHNHFRTDWSGGTSWDWSLPSPYEEDKP